MPLSTQAFTIISSLPCLAGNSYVFPGHRDGRPLSGMAMEMLLRRMGRNDITVHGFRSTFRDWAAEQPIFLEKLVNCAWRMKLAMRLSVPIGEVTCCLNVRD